jgi:UDPglucose--hexose-1-phosphate uridylyltransferase
MKEYAEADQPKSNAPQSQNGRPNLLLEYANFELSVERSSGRVVASNDDWVAVVSWWAIWPFEILCKFLISSILFGLYLYT